MAQCKTRADLHREYARVIDMCEGTNIDPLECVKCDGLEIDEGPFFDWTVHSYQFALAIVEGKPVFPGDLLYNSNTKKRHFIDSVIDKNHDDWSWNQPQPKKMVLNDTEIPSAVAAQQLSNNVIVVFEKINDATVFFNAIDKTFNGK